MCVVGLGGSGLTAVSELTAMGFKVIGIDGKDVGGGAAGKNGGFLLAGLPEFYHDAVKKFGHDFALTRYKKTLDELDQVFRAFPSCTRRTGSLRIASDAEELLDCR